MTTTPTQPRAMPMTAAIHFGASIQRTFTPIAITAPPQTIARIAIRQAPSSTSSPNGV